MAAYLNSTAITVNGGSHTPSSGSNLCTVFVHGLLGNPRPSAISGQEFDQGGGGSDALTIESGFDDWNPGNNMGGFAGYRHHGSTTTAGTCDYSVDTGDDDGRNGIAITVEDVDSGTPLDAAGSAIATHSSSTSSATHTMNAESGQSAVFWCFHRATESLPSLSGWTERLNVAIDQGPVQTQIGVWTRDFTGSVTSVQLTGMTSAADGISGVYLFNDAPAGVTMTPGAGTLTLAGQTPLRFEQSNRLPASAALSLTGQTPIRLENSIRAPAAAALALTGQTPVRLEASIRLPASAVLTLLGFAPTVTDSGDAGVTMLPPAGTLTLTGATPLRVENAIRLPAAAALALTGQTPVRLENSLRAPGAGTLTLTGATPARLENSIRLPASAVLTLLGFAPLVVDSGDNSVTMLPDAAVLTLTGATPLRAEASIRLPASGTLTAAGATPLRTEASLRAPGAAALTLAGQAPTIPVFITLPAGVLTLAGAVPVLATAETVLSLPDGRIFVVTADNRVLTVSGDRTFVVPDDRSRTFALD